MSHPQIPELDASPPPQMESPGDSDRVPWVEHAPDRRLEITLCVIAFALGALMAWRTRFRVNSDAMNYLDLGDAIFRGEWSTAINGLWSPLYPAIQGFALKIVRPSTYWESTVAHGVNLLLYAAAMACFAYFLRGFRFVPGRQRGDLEAPGRWPQAPWLILAYTLFVGCSLVLIRMSVLAPDILVAGLVYLAAGLLLRIAGGERGWRTFAGLGAVLGLAYLAKAPMWWGALLFLAAAFGSVRDARAAIPRIALAVCLFVLIGSFYFVPLSLFKRRATISDSARLNYAFHMNGVPYLHWQGEPAGSGVPLHPTRRLMATPEVYEFAAPVGGTYPPWFDPSYWLEGVRFAWKPQHVGRFLVNLIDLYYVVIDTFQISLLVGLGVLCAYAWNDPASLRAVAWRHWYLVFPSLAILVMYSLVHVEPRYIAPFIALLWLGLYSAVSVPDIHILSARRLLASVGLAVVLGMTVEMAGLLVLRMPSEEKSAEHGHVQWKVSQELKRLGIRPGDRLASLGSGYTAYWARLAGSKIVAETRRAADFWAADEKTRSEILEIFAKTGARGVVAREVPPVAASAGWHALGNSGFSFYRLRS